MAISQSACVPIFVVSIFFLNENVTLPKLLAISICIAGVVVVSVQPEEEGSGEHPSTTTSGLFWSFGYLGLCSAYMVLWGETVSWRTVVGKQDLTLLMLTLMGAATLLLLWWPLLILGCGHLEPGLLPVGSQWTLVASNAALAVFNNITMSNAPLL